MNYTVVTFLDKLQATAKQHRKNATEIDDLIKELGDVKNKRFKDVEEIELEVGKIYIIRRTFNDSTSEPCMARYEKSGWRDLWGQISYPGKSLEILT